MRNLNERSWLIAVVASKSRSAIEQHVDERCRNVRKCQFLSCWHINCVQLFQLGRQTRTEYLFPQFATKDSTWTKSALDSCAQHYLQSGWHSCCLVAHPVQRQASTVSTLQISMLKRPQLRQLKRRQLPPLKLHRLRPRQPARRRCWTWRRILLSSASLS